MSCFNVRSTYVKRLPEYGGRERETERASGYHGLGHVGLPWTVAWVKVLQSPSMEGLHQGGGRSNNAQLHVATLLRSRYQTGLCYHTN